MFLIIADVVPIYMDSHQFVMQQRQQTYKDLLNALQVMRIVDSNTQKPQLFLAMFLIETGNLKYDTNLQVSI